jgi:hypothetical protein
MMPHLILSILCRFFYQRANETGGDEEEEETKQKSQPTKPSFTNIFLKELLRLA